MHLKQLNLTNFRNYSALKLEFDNRPTILVGNNAAGKSNILEAIYLLSVTKSLRVETEDELIKKNEQFARIEGVVDDINLQVIINKQDNFRKKVLVNGVSRRTVDFVGNLPAVIFYPSDINMVTGAPTLRRWHLDLCLAQIDPYYKKTLTLYEQYLITRNRVLKKIREGQAKSSELDYWTGELVKHGEIITDKRQAFFDFINTLQTPLGKYKFEYKHSEISFERLKETNGREVAAAATLIGPHRDDFDIVILNGVKESLRMQEQTGRDPSLITQDGLGRSLRHYGSRGEQRTGTLVFKLAQLEYMAKILGKRPILLLDDVFSELDAVHRAHVVEVVSKQQTIIATVELDNIPKKFLDSSRILRIEDGKITS